MPKAKRHGHAAKAERKTKKCGNGKSVFQRSVSISPDLSSGHEGWGCIFLVDFVVAVAIVTLLIAVHAFRLESNKPGQDAVQVLPTPVPPPRAVANCVCRQDLNNNTEQSTGWLHKCSRAWATDTLFALLMKCPKNDVAPPPGENKRSRRHSALPLSLASQFFHRYRLYAHIESRLTAQRIN